MKFNFRKISAVASSVLMTGMTLGMAAAASYPAPFVEDGVADVALVYGADAAVDMTPASSIQTSLAGYVSSEGTTVITGGESFQLEKTSNKFNLGDALNSIYTSLDEDEMPNTLVEGDYDDGAIDTEFDQDVDLSTEKLTLFTDSHLNDNAPTLGFNFQKNDPVLNYTIAFDDAYNLSEFEGTDMPLMGKEFYVLDTSNSKLELLESASTVTIVEGETITVGDKTIKATFIGNSGTAGNAKFEVNGEITDLIDSGENDKLNDGSYIVLKEVLYSSKESVQSQVEIAIGAGLLLLEDGEEIEMNEERVDNLVSYFNPLNFDELIVEWKAAEDIFLEEGDSAVMPGFNSLQVIYGGLDFGEAEIISFDSGEELTISGSFDIPTFRTNGTVINATMGEENYPLINDTDAMNVDLSVDDRFLLTILPTSNDLSDAETRYYEVSKIDVDGSDYLIEFDDLIGNDDVILDELGAQDEGDYVFNLISAVDDTNAILNFTSAVGVVKMDTIVTDAGLTITLPADPTTGVLTIIEADGDENINSGDVFTVDVGVDVGEEELQVDGTNVTTLESSSDKVYIGYVESELATKVEWDKSSDINEFEIEYYGKEVTADVTIASAEASTTQGGDALGNVIFKDSETASYSSKNIVIVGGSCINKAASTALGVADHTCGGAFTTATGVGAGEFLIKGVQDAFSAGKLALVVAGYEAADTVAAANYVANKEFDTSKTLKGTTATEVVTEVA